MLIDPRLRALSLIEREPVVTSHETRIGELVGLMVENGIRRVPVVSRHGDMVGIVISRDVLDYIAGSRSNIWILEQGRDFARALSAVPVGRIMSRHVVFIPHTASVKEAIETLLRTGVGGLPLVKERRVVGIVEERDFAQLIPRKTGIPVEYHMSRHVVTANPSMSYLDLCRFMVTTGIRRMPVMMAGELRGIVTSMDLLKVLNLERVRELILRGLADEIFRMEARSFMTRNVVTIQHDEDMGKAAELMVEEEITGLPVIRKEKLVGIITAHDLLKWLFYNLRR